jgi:outer membrane protein assembly factor BamE (lipoprotein component of BamABCDE complex)
MASKPVAVFAAALCLMGLGAAACTPTVAYNGFQAREDKPADIKVGVDTKSTVLARLGSPSMTATFEPNIWFYISQQTRKVAYRNPKIETRDVVAVTFGADEKVSAIKMYSLKNGYQIAYAKAETPTRGRELSVLEQLLGNIGRGSMLPQDNDPGQRPGGR